MDIAALEEIKRLKHRYLRCVDLKLWDEIGDALTADATAEYGTAVRGGPVLRTGRDAIVGFLRESLPPSIITAHSAQQPEIHLDGDTATGIWAFTDTVIATEHDSTMVRGAAFYEDRYERGADGRWRIRHTGFTRTYEYVVRLGDLPGFQLTADRWTRG
ncbi:nuclear transport factor 2 family protein [Saccharopolyspora sp. MS10]|uniref:nuclear transport factor 2 family protein n=1 Tax=Saccharopolyspora sp. MS10 TaxID=3385973 RepID=UPI0039A0ED8B